MKSDRLKTLVSRHALSIFIKAKANDWQETCSSFSLKCDPKPVCYATICRWFGSSFNFSTLLLPGNRHRFMLHLFLSQPKALRSRDRGYISELRWTSRFEESHFSLCSPFTSGKFVAATASLSSSTAIGPDRVTYPMLEHLPSSVCSSLFPDDLAMWSFSPSVPVAAEATQGALIGLVCWSKHWCLPVNQSKFWASFFAVNLHKPNFHPHLCLLNSPLRFNPAPTFLGVIFDRTLSFPSSRGLTLCLCFLTGPLQKVLFFTKLFSGLFSLMFHSDDYISLGDQHYEIRAPTPSGHSRHHRMPIVVPIPPYLKGILTPLRVALTHFVLSSNGGGEPSSSNFLFHFRLSQISSET